MRWARAISVVLLAVCYGWVLPSHRHGPVHAHHEHGHAEAHHDHGHGHAHHPDDGDGGGEGRDPDADHAHCEICYAARTMYRAPDVAPALRAPDVVAVAEPLRPERALDVRLIPAYHGRAPPVSA